MPGSVPIDADESEEQLQPPLALRSEACKQVVGALAEQAREPAVLAQQPAVEAVALALVPQPLQCVLDQRQGARLVARGFKDQLAHFAHVESREPRRAIDHLVQDGGADQRQCPGLADLILLSHEARQVLGEPVEEVGTHCREDEQRAFAVPQCGREQHIEAPALLGVGGGEQLLELVNREQEGAFVPLAAAQPEG